MHTERPDAKPAPSFSEEEVKGEGGGDGLAEALPGLFAEFVVARERGLRGSRSTGAVKADAALVEAEAEVTTWRVGAQALSRAMFKAGQDNARAAQAFWDEWWSFHLGALIDGLQQQGGAGGGDGGGGGGGGGGADERTCAGVLAAAAMLSSGLGCLHNDEGQPLVDIELWGANVRAVPLAALLDLASSSVVRRRIVIRWLLFAVSEGLLGAEQLVPAWPHVEKALRLSAHTRKWAGVSGDGSGSGRADLASTPELRDRVLCLSALARAGMNAAPGFAGVVFEQMVRVLVAETKRQQEKKGGPRGTGSADGRLYGDVAAEAILDGSKAHLIAIK